MLVDVRSAVRRTKTKLLKFAAGLSLLARADLKVAQMDLASCVLKCAPKTVKPG